MWFVEITTDVGKLVFPFMSETGYRSKQEAEFVASESMRKVPGIMSAKVFEKGDGQSVHQ